LHHNLIASVGGVLFREALAGDSAVVFAGPGESYSDVILRLAAEG
jgi:hypothetical protein